MIQQAVFFQQSESLQEEFRLVELTALREIYLEKLKNVIAEVNEERRPFDFKAIFDTFSIINKLREATLDMVNAIQHWQQGFTKIIRPQLHQCDYVSMRMIKDTDFVNSTKLRRKFNFQIGRGNFLLLPLPNPRSILPVPVNNALCAEVLKFGNPPEDRIVQCYHILLNCMPPKYFRKMLPIEKWLIDKWKPQILLIGDYFEAPQSPTQLNHTNSTPTTNISKPAKSRGGNKSTANNSRVVTARSAATVARATGGDVSAAPPPIMMRGRRGNLTPLNRPSSTNEINNLMTISTTSLGSDQPSHPGSHTSNDTGSGTGAKQDVTSSQPGPGPVTPSSSATAALRAQEPSPTRQPMMLLPKVGRRAVATIVVGGQRVVEEGAQAPVRTRLDALKQLATKNILASVQATVQQASTNSTARPTLLLLRNKLQSQGAAQLDTAVLYKSQSAAGTPSTAQRPALALDKTTAHGSVSSYTSPVHQGPANNQAPSTPLTAVTVTALQQQPQLSSPSVIKTSLHVSDRESSLSTASLRNVATAAVPVDFSNPISLTGLDHDSLGMSTRPASSEAWHSLPVLDKIKPKTPAHVEIFEFPMSAPLPPTTPFSQARAKKSTDVLTIEEKATKTSLTTNDMRNWFVNAK